VYVDVGLFEEDNPIITVDICSIPLKEEEGVSIIYRSKNTNPKYRVNLGYLEDDEGGAHYIIITKLHVLFKKKYQAKNGEKICYWCKAVFRNDKLEAFEKHPISCQQRISYVHTDFWSRIMLPKERELIKFNNRHVSPARFVFYADFEGATGHDGKQYPICYCLFCPDLYKPGYLEGLKKFYNQDEEKVVEQLCKDLEQISNKAFYNLNKDIKLKPLTKEEQEKFDKADKCDRCKQEFTVDNKKCRHHDM
jgi:hypothetical protein